MQEDIFISEDTVMQCICGSVTKVGKYKKKKSLTIPNPKGGSFQPVHYYCECDPKRARAYNQGEGQIIVSDKDLAWPVSQEVLVS